MTEVKVALVVRGGWDGHEPVETTESVMPFLSAQGFEIRIEEGTAAYADEEFMSSVDLIVQVNTMNTIADKELAGLTRAVIGGAGLAGWHGGIADSYRNSADYLQLIGGQFAHHAAVPQEERTGQQSDHYLDFTVNIVDAAGSIPSSRASRTSTCTPSSTGCSRTRTTTCWRPRKSCTARSTRGIERSRFRWCGLGSGGPGASSSARRDTSSTS